MRWLALTVAVVALGGCGVTDVVTGGREEVLLRVNCGASEEYVDRKGAHWLPDREMAPDLDWGAIGGMTTVRWYLTPTGTDSPDVYLSERFDMEAYEFMLPDGTYDLRLHFAETYEGVAFESERIFSVAVNGQIVLPEVDILEAAGGFGKPVVERVRGIRVTDGRLRIDFQATTQHAEINGIEVIARQPGIAPL
jgi:hypothetical protein